MSELSLLLRRSDMAESAVGDKYLASTEYTSIILPFTPNDNPIIAAECYIDRTTMGISGSYHSVMGVGNNTTPGMMCKSWSQGYFQPRSWSGAEPYTAPVPWTGWEVSYPDMTSLVRTASAQYSGTFSGNVANANNFYLRLRDTFAYHKITVTISGSVAYRFVPALDNNGIACLCDEINHQYYYDTNGAAVLIDAPI